MMYPNADIMVQNELYNCNSLPTELARSYVPFQQLTCIYPPMKALAAGTIFPELNKPYDPNLCKAKCNNNVSCEARPCFAETEYNTCITCEAGPEYTVDA